MSKECDNDKQGEKISSSLYQAMCAYSKEHKRINAKGPDRVVARCLLVAVEAFNKEMEEYDDIDVIEGDEGET